MEFQIGSAKDLEKRLENPEVVLVRAINDYELDELLVNGPNNHIFHVGTNYERFYGNMVGRYAMRGSGTIVVYTPKEDDLVLGYFKNETDSWFSCEKEFSGSVDVYNVYNKSHSDLLKRCLCSC